jgi:hypothetical protein
MTAGDTVGLVQVDVKDVAGGEIAAWEAQMDLSQKDIDYILRVPRVAAE